MSAKETTYPGKELEALSVAMNYHRWIVDEIAPYLGGRSRKLEQESGASRG